MLLLVSGFYLFEIWLSNPSLLVGVWLGQRGKCYRQQVVGIIFFHEPAWSFYFRSWGHWHCALFWWRSCSSLLFCWFPSACWEHSVFVPFPCVRVRHLIIDYITLDAPLILFYIPTLLPVQFLLSWWTLNFSLLSVEDSFKYFLACLLRGREFHLLELVLELELHSPVW